MNRETIRRAISAFLQQQGVAFEIVELNFMDAWLSNVRDQGETGSCMFVAATACIEMHCHKLKVEAARCEEFYLDIQDVFENLFKVYPDEDMANDIEGEEGAPLDEVFRYARDYGLIITDRCKDPQPRNILSCFCHQSQRVKIQTYTTLQAAVAFAYASDTPLVTAMDDVFTSFHRCQEAIYQGPYPEEFLDLDNEINKEHSMFIVGNAKLRMNDEIHDYFVIQNSYGEAFGYEGYALVRTELVDYFWLPLISMPNEKKYED